MKIACCGEHTTHSSGWKPGQPPEYPARVGALLADAGRGFESFEVANFGFATAVVTPQVQRRAALRAPCLRAIRRRGDSRRVGQHPRIKHLTAGTRGRRARY
jgi:hypothetical protein